VVNGAGGTRAIQCLPKNREICTENYEIEHQPSEKREPRKRRGNTDLEDGSGDDLPSIKETGE